MQGTHLVITVTSRSLCEKFISFFQEQGVSVVLSSPCHGTASAKILDYLGLENTEKAILFAVTTGRTAKGLMGALVRRMRIDVPGNGISFSVPVDSIGGANTLRYMTDGQHNLTSEVTEMNEAPYELIVAIANQGSNELVMDAAKSAGATGGTVIHAKGSGMENAKKFFGVSIAAEKEMIFIVAKHDSRNEIMKAIIQKAGVHSEAQALVFSVPVNAVAGMRFFEDLMEDE